MRRPYGFGKDEDAMDMVRHYHIRIQGYLREMAWNLPPTLLNEVSQSIQDDIPIQDMPEEALVLERDQGDVIPSRLSVIIPLQADGSAANLQCILHLKRPAWRR